MTGWSTHAKIWQMDVGFGFGLIPRWAFEVWDERGRLIRDGFAWTRWGAIRRAKYIAKNALLFDREPEVVEL